MFNCSRSSLYVAAQLLPAISTRRCSAGSSTPAAALCPHTVNRHNKLTSVDKDLDLSGSCDVISHVTIRLPIGHFLIASSDSFSIKCTVYPQYIRYRRQTDRKTQHCSISTTVKNATNYCTENWEYTSNSLNSPGKVMPFSHVTQTGKKFSNLPITTSCKHKRQFQYEPQVISCE